MDWEAEEEASRPENLTSQFEDDGSLLSALKSCAQKKDLLRGSRLHATILKWGLLGRRLSLANSLINLYSKSGRLSAAQRILDELLVLDVVSWTVLIAGYTQHGCNKQALRCFERMQFYGTSPNAVTFSCILKACGNLGELERGQGVHADIVSKGLLMQSVVLGGALVNMYVKCGALAQAQQVFIELPNHNVVSWTALLTGYCDHEDGEQALVCLQQMKCEGLSPNAVTFSCILKACGNMCKVDEGTKSHADIIRAGFLDTDSVLGIALVDMYCRCGVLEKAQQVFDELIVWDVVTWNVLVTGYTNFGYGEMALCCFERMKHEGFAPNAVTFALILKACSVIGAGQKGKEIHSEIGRQGLLRKGNGLENALIDMYAKCGVLAKARQLFDGLSDRDVVSWNILLTGYCQHSLCEEALECYEHMQHEGLSPDNVTFVCVLKACGSTGAAKKGIEVHVEVARKDSLGKDATLGNALVDMYAKSGTLVKAQEVFDKLALKNLVSWTSLISGFCERGHYEEALSHFEQMECEGVCPDVVTLACILKACGSIKVTEKGQMYCDHVSANYGIIPAREHHTCIVELFGRGRQFDKVIAIMKEAPFSHGLSSWFLFLSASRKRGNIDLASFAFEYARRWKITNPS